MPYMLTGSVASSAHGIPRSTLDLDIVIAPTREQVHALIQQFASSQYYADEQQALQALANRSQFNIIDLSSGWKMDFIIAEESEYGRTALQRRRAIQVGQRAVYFASPRTCLSPSCDGRNWAALIGSFRMLLVLSVHKATS